MKGFIHNGFLLLIVLLAACKKEKCTSDIDKAISPNISTTTLIDIIKYYQGKYVKTSYNDRDCFTWSDYDDFKQSNVPECVKNDLKSSCLFFQFIGYIKELSDSEQDNLINRGLSTCQPTWAQQGKVSTSGQTDAGQDAQIDIAKAIVGLVKDYL